MSSSITLKKEIPLPPPLPGTFLIYSNITSSFILIPIPPPLPSFDLSSSSSLSSSLDIQNNFGIKLQSINKYSSSSSSLSSSSLSCYSKHKSTKKMKSLFWNKITSNEIKKNKLWQSITIDLLDELPINYKILEDRFSIIDENKGFKRRLSMSDVPSNIKLKSLLDNGRTQNILISAGKIRATPDNILTLIKELNPLILTEDVVKIVQNMIPTDEERKLLSVYNGSSTLLGPAERILLSLCEVPRLKERLLCHLTILTWISSTNKILHKLSTLQKICDLLMTETSLEHLTQLIKYVLAIGNYLNYGSNRITTVIKFDSILKFQDIRSDYNPYSNNNNSNNNSTNNNNNNGGIGNSNIDNTYSNTSDSTSRYTLLTFLVSELMKNCPETLSYICETWSEIINLAEGEILYSQLLIDVSHLQNDFMKVKEEYEICRQKNHDELITDYNSSLLKKIESFLETSPKLFDELKFQLNQTKISFQNTLQIFGEILTADGKTIEGNEISLIFLTTLNKVISSLTQTRKDIEKNIQLSNEIRLVSSSYSSSSLLTSTDENGTPRRRWNSNSPATTVIPPPPPPPSRDRSTRSPTSPNDSIQSIQSVESSESIVVETLLPSTFLSSPLTGRRKSQTLQTTPSQDFSSSLTSNNSSNSLSPLLLSPSSSVTAIVISNESEIQSKTNKEELNNTISSVSQTNQINSPSNSTSQESEIKENTTTGKSKTEKSKSSRPKARNATL